MKKCVVVILTLLLFFGLVGCGEKGISGQDNGNTKDKIYTSDDLSLFDTNTNKSICLGDTKETVEKVLGQPDEKPMVATSKGMQPGKKYLYNNIGIDVSFDDDGYVTRFQLSKIVNAKERERFKLASHLSMDSSVDEFMNQYPDAVDVEDIGAFKRKMICLIEKDGVLSVVGADTTYKHFSIYVDYDDTFVRFVVMQVDGVSPNEEKAKDLKSEEASSVSSPKSEVTSEPTAAPTLKTQTANGGSVSELMEKAIAAAESGDKKSAIQYAEMACEAQGVEAKILSDDELSKLEQRQEEIERLVGNDSSGVDLESKIALSMERLNNLVLIFYNQMLDF